MEKKLDLNRKIRRYVTLKQLDISQELDLYTFLEEFSYATGETIEKDACRNWKLERERSRTLYTVFFRDKFKERGEEYGLPQELFYTRYNTIGQYVYSDLIQNRVTTSFYDYENAYFTFMQNPFCYGECDEFLRVFSKRAGEDNMVVLGAFGLNSDKDKKFKLSLLSDFEWACSFSNQVITDSYTHGDYYGAYVMSKQKVLTAARTLNLHSVRR